jgi:hypothetical protein
VEKFMEKIHIKHNFKSFTMDLIAFAESARVEMMVPAVNFWPELNMTNKTETD